MMEERIASFKANESKEVALLVLEDANLRKVLVVWPMAEISVADTVGETWESLWQVVKFSDEQVAELAGISLGVCKQTLRRAIGLRLIYPDGSLHGLARMALQKRIKDALQG